MAQFESFDHSELLANQPHQAPPPEPVTSAVEVKSLVASTKRVLDAYQARLNEFEAKKARIVKSYRGDMATGHLDSLKEKYADIFTMPDKLREFSATAEASEEFFTPLGDYCAARPQRSHACGTVG